MTLNMIHTGLNNTSTTIGIFLLPHEIDMFQRLVYQLRRNFATLDSEERRIFDIKIHAGLCMSSTMMDWETSAFAPEYFTDKLAHLERSLDDCDSVVFETTPDNILGCTSYRRWLAEILDTEYVTWLDCDMILGDNFLRTLMYSLDSIDRPNVVVTPQIVRVWDSTWDVLVNEDYLHWDHERYKTEDLLPITMASDMNDVTLIQSPRIKFAGGWGTTISKALLDAVRIPSSFSHYGLEDTFIMVCSQMWTDHKGGSYTSPVQYVMNGCIVGEDYLNRDQSYITKHLTPLDRRSEFKSITEERWFPEIISFEHLLHSGDI